MFNLNEDSSSPNNDNVEDRFGVLPEDLEILAEGFGKRLAEVPQDKKPDWYDDAKFKLGQKFAIRNSVGVNYSAMLALFTVFSFESYLKPAMFNGKSGTPFAAFKRYLSSYFRVESWYESDIFTVGSSGYNSIRIVKQIHSTASKNASALSREKLNEVVKNTNKNMVSSIKDSISDSFAEVSCPYMQQLKRTVPGYDYSNVVNQQNMSLSQFSFFGLVILFPERFGVSNATDEELEGFIHLWRVIGYLLGIEDRYNFCNGSLSEVKRRTQNLINYWIKPNFLNLTAEWEHYCRCVIEGLNFYVLSEPFEVPMLYLCEMLNISTRDFYAKLSWITYFRYLRFKWFMCCVLKFSWVKYLVNWYVRKMSEEAKHFSDHQLNVITEISNKYMKL